MNILNLYRHSRGFGVHSPWAYTIVREVLPGRGAAYYAYSDIDRVFGRDARLARKVFRLLVHFNPAGVAVTRDVRWVWLAHQADTRGKGGKVGLITDPTEFIGWLDCETLIFTCLDTDAGRRAWQQAAAETPAMAIDTHRRLGIISRRPGLPTQTIHLRTLLNDQ